ncbi:MAG TPA: hypothetical protein EYM83_03955 [Nitrospirales bacterium]|nr:hypothetical protein [Nitrospirales bacterium]
MDLITSEQKESLARAQAAIQAQLQVLPLNQKIGILVALLALIGGGYWYLFFSPLQIQIDSVRGEITELDQQITIDEAKAGRLDELKKEYEEIGLDLARLQEALPPEEEAANLLQQISEMSRPKGLDLTSWTPGQRNESKDGLSVALPVTISMSGGYHAIATFFDQIKNLKRVVSVSGVRLGSATLEEASQGAVQVGGTEDDRAAQSRMKIQGSFTVTAYASPRGSSKEGAASAQ